MAKSTQAQMNQRITEVKELMLNGFTRSHIIQHGSEKWGITERQVDEYITRANAITKEINLLTLQDNLALITNGLWDVYRKAATQTPPNLSEMRQTLQGIAKLKGLDQQTVNHVIEDKRELSDLTNADLDSILENPDAHH